MSDVDVIAVIGTCSGQRREFSQRFARTTGRDLFPSMGLRTSRDPLRQVLEYLPWTGPGRGAVCELPAATRPAELVELFCAPGSGVRLTEIICVVDAAHVIDDLRRDGYFTRRVVRHGIPITEYSASAMLTVLQIESATSLVLCNWQHLPAQKLATVRALLGRLSPRATQILKEQEPAGFGALIDSDAPGVDPALLADAPGWVAMLEAGQQTAENNGETVMTRMADPRVSAFYYEQLRPLHPLRLRQLLDDRIEDGEFGTVIRSAGFCRLATRPGTVGMWEQVGQMFSLEPIQHVRFLDEFGPEDEQPSQTGLPSELLAIGQELAFIGLDLNEAALIEALDEASLTDEELTAGPESWSRFEDPFPAWLGVS